MKLKKFIPELARAISEAGFDKESRAVQDECIPKIKSGADLTIIAPEGSGKSTTLVISLIQQLKEAMHDAPRAIVFVADKAKAQELELQFKLLGKYTNLRFFTAMEKGSIQDQKDDIYEGVDILIGTPKRIKELINISGISTMNLKHLVIDDAEIIFQNRHHQILFRFVDSVQKLQCLIFANIYHKRFETLSNHTSKKPIILKIETPE